MLKSKLLAVAALSGLMLAAPAVMADRDGSRFEHRADRQQARIEHGVRNGSLTRKEAKILRRDQRELARMERRFAKDGRLDKHERKVLKREYRDASQRIRHFKHDDDYRHKHKYTYKHKDRYRVDDRYWDHDRRHKHSWVKHDKRHYRWPGHGVRLGDDGWWVLFGYRD